MPGVWLSQRMQNLGEIAWLRRQNVGIHGLLHVRRLRTGFHYGVWEIRIGRGRKSGHFPKIFKGFAAQSRPIIAFGQTHQKATGDFVDDANCPGFCRMRQETGQISSPATPPISSSPRLISSRGQVRTARLTPLKVLALLPSLRVSPTRVVHEGTMIDLASETLLTFAQACAYLPRRRRGRHAHTSTLWRWATRGLRGHKLEVIRVGGVVYTSREALQRFADRLSGTVPERKGDAAVETRQRRVEKELADEGF